MLPLRLALFVVGYARLILDNFVVVEYISGHNVIFISHTVYVTKKYARASPPDTNCGLGSSSAGKRGNTNGDSVELIVEPFFLRQGEQVWNHAGHRGLIGAAVSGNGTLYLLG